MQMIHYDNPNFVKEFSEEAVNRTRELPLYLGGPAVDYTDALHAYALSATLLHDSERPPKDVLVHGPSKKAQVLLVERASGHGVIGSFSGVTGYIDTLFNPSESSDEVRFFDPIAFTLRDELVTECGFEDRTFGLVDFYAGVPTVEPRTANPEARITVVPVLGLCTERPEIVLDPRELASYKWTNLEDIKITEKLSAGYRTVTLPSALGALGMHPDAIAKLLDK